MTESFLSYLTILGWDRGGYWDSDALLIPALWRLNIPSPLSRTGRMTEVSWVSAEFVVWRVLVNKSVSNHWPGYWGALGLNLIIYPTGLHLTNFSWHTQAFSIITKTSESYSYDAGLISPFCTYTIQGHDYQKTTYEILNISFIVQQHSSSTVKYSVLCQLAYGLGCFKVNKKSRKNLQHEGFHLFVFWH